MSKMYMFTIVLAGHGDNEDQAWTDAIEGFCLEPGITPKEYVIEEVDDE